jgi:peptidoglycan/xylan/chitin deacetylase (PgdA/CDA1 family)
MTYPLERVCARPVPILMYHQCPEDILREHFQWIDDNGYTPVHLSDVADYFEDPRPDLFPEKKIVLTFDDALQDFFDHAYPLLKNEFNFTATVCVPTHWVSDDPKRSEWEHGSREPTMTWGKLGILVKEGFEIISHSVTHESFDKFETDTDRLRYEIGESKRALIRELEIEEVRFFCFPYGAGWGKEKPEMVLAEEEYKGALRAGYAGEGWNCYCIPRWGISCPLTIGDIINTISGCR